MILQSLVDYYEILAKSGEISKPGYGKVNVSFALNLSPQGNLLNVIPLKNPVQRGKKTVEVPRSMEVPAQEKKTVGIKSNFLCENASYLLGVDAKGKPERAKQCFEAFAALHHKVLDGVDSIPAKAVLAFIDSWQPQAASECEALQEYYDELLTGANLVFMVQGTDYVQEDSLVRDAWEQYCTQKPGEGALPCLVTGKTAPVARLHPSIKGVKNAQSMGASLVSFNAMAYESYGHEQKDDTGQGLNAPVSEYAAFAYTTALNHLLADADHKQTAGDTTIVYWAMSTNPIYRNLFKFSLSPGAEQTPDSKKVDKEAEDTLADVFRKIVEGEAVAEDVPDAFDAGTRFFVLGLAPNAARLSVRFFLANTFGNILKNVAQHYRDLDIEHSPADFTYLPVWKLLDETVSSKTRVKEAQPLLSGAVMRSILAGTPYPETLLANVLLRARAEQDDEERRTRKITRGRAAIIKACLLRKNRKTYEEVATVSLNNESNNRAYVLGRLFAVLEKTQQDANQKDFKRKSSEQVQQNAQPGINSTIKDRYFSSACTMPVNVYPALFKLYQNHIEKIRKKDNGKGIAINHEK
ncbi:MAG: type I-C CRISPR-associated protein Cas8c/Csd1, partial [Ethanoligenens sp.]